MSRHTTLALLLLVCAATLIVGCVWARERVGENPVTSVESAKFVSIYDDKGVTHQKNNFGDGTKQIYDRMLKHTMSAGHSEVLLVQGQDFHDALLATDKILFGSQQADPVYRNTEKDCWLFVSLGAATAGSRNVGPVSIDRKNGVITFEYGPADDVLGQLVRGYAYWVPLGRVTTGTYTLHLLPRGSKRPTQSRVVAFCDLEPN
jgi:hypothetical protein